MIDLTPLDVRKKSGDFRKGLRGYDPQQVDGFLELVAERLEEVVKENLTLTERVERLSEQVQAQTGRERAVQEALVTAQELRDDIRGQAQKEADRIRRDAERDALHREREAELQARDIVADAERLLKERQVALEELERRRAKFLNAFRQLLQREMDVVAVEEGRSPLAEVPVELELGGGREVPAAAPAEAAAQGDGAARDRVEPTDPELADADAVDVADDEAPVSLLAIAPDDDATPEPEADVHTLAAAAGVETEARDVDGQEEADDEEPILDIGLLAGAPTDEKAGPTGADAPEPGEGPPRGPRLDINLVAGMDGPSGETPGAAEDDADPAAEGDASRGDHFVSPHADIPTLEVLLGEVEEDDDDRG
jgi:DivIVA domain-containing protein